MIDPETPLGSSDTNTGGNHWVCWLLKILGLRAQHRVDGEGAEVSVPGDAQAEVLRGWAPAASEALAWHAGAQTCSLLAIPRGLSL